MAVSKPLCVIPEGTGCCQVRSLRCLGWRWTSFVFAGARRNLRRGQDGAPAARARTNDLDDVGVTARVLWLERSCGLAAFGGWGREGRVQLQCPALWTVGGARKPGAGHPFAAVGAAWSCCGRRRAGLNQADDLATSGGHDTERARARCVPARLTPRPWPGSGCDRRAGRSRRA